MKDVLIIGIAGGTGSGKTTLARNIADHFGDKISLIRHDDYYKAHNGMSLEELAALNYDHPDAFDWELLFTHLEALKRGEAVECPIYDYAVHNRSNKTRRVEATPVILLEGILIFDSERVCSMLDLKIFVDTDADVRILRRILRDVKKRGRTLDSVITQYLTTVKPMHEAFVEPSKKRADIIIPEGGKNPIAYGMIIDRIEKHLNK
ncbi:MAG: uridine kinase [Clostridia bacterium]|nr:uridine kinase [Clostridia bacterium]